MSESPSDRPVVTRFAPSPTGYLHIGGARTALFNWLYARRNGGTFLLRIEDTDRARSTPEATEAIFEGLTWLGLDWDGDAVSQFARAARHAEVAYMMLEIGHAYKCFSTQAEIEAYREAARAEGRSTLFRSPWRDVTPDRHPEKPFVVRLKAPREGETVIHDAVQGRVRVTNEQLDDMILLRSNGSPTYMLAVVVDDFDMGVTHIVRGDDHLTNAARQCQIWRVMGWDEPVWAHIPLIHGEDGKKLSKRHGALSVQEYQAEGYSAAGMVNYLSRLGWSHGDDEFFTVEQATEWFDLKDVRRAPARLDLTKLANLSGQHIAASDDGALVAEILEYLAASGQDDLTDEQGQALHRAMYALKDRAKTFAEILEKAQFVLKKRPITPDEDASRQLTTASRRILAELTPHLQTASWDRDTLEEIVGAHAAENGIKMGKLAGPLRAALAGRTVSPSVFDMMLILGREESVSRIEDSAA
ncbi:MAG: glutamate--tRNA ligase [Pseudomonadota bacterium]